MRILVTGGTGFVGSHLVEALLDRGHAVVCLARERAKAERLFGERQPELVVGDLLDDQALRRACSGVDAVAHLAGLTAARSRAEFLRVNSEGTRALVAAAAAVGGPRRFVYVSSLAAAGPTARGVPLREEQGSGPVSHYGASKRAGEDAVRRFAAEWTILRPPAVYGPRDKEFLRLFRAAATWGLAPLFGDGSQELSLVFAPDLAQAVVSCLESGAPGAVLYPTHPEIVTARELALAIASAAAPGRTPRLLRVPRSAVRPMLWLTGGAARLAGRATLLSPDKRGEILAEAWTCSPEPLAVLTGWRADTGLGVGLARTAEWYRAAGWL